MLGLSDSEIYDAANKAVRNYVSKVFPGFFRDDDLEQVVIDVATSVWKSSHTFDESRGTVFSWIYTFAKNGVLDAVAKEKRYRSRFVTFTVRDCVDYDGNAIGITPVANDETDDSLIAKDTERTLREAVSSDRDKRLLDGLIKGLDSSELAAAEGVETSKIYTPVCRLRSKLSSAA